MAAGALGTTTTSPACRRVAAGSGRTLIAAAALRALATLLIATTALAALLVTTTALGTLARTLAAAALRALTVLALAALSAAAACLSADGRAVLGLGVRHVRRRLGGVVQRGGGVGAHRQHDLTGGHAGGTQQ